MTENTPEESPYEEDEELSPPAGASQHRIQPSSFPEDEPDYTPEIEHTLAFFPDSRASEVVLAETVNLLIDAGRIGRGIVELKTVAGVAIAKALRERGLPYDVMLFDNAGSVPEYKPESVIGKLYADAASQFPVETDSIHQLNANYVVIPAVEGSGRRRVDFAVNRDLNVDLAETTLPGYVMKMIEADSALTGNKAEVLFIDVPERGLVQESDGTYQRRVIHVGFGDDEDLSAHDAERDPGEDNSPQQ